MKKYRTKFDIVADILTVCLSSPCDLNRLFYSLSISYSRLKDLTGSMVETGLLDKGEFGFSTTAKGERFLALYSELYSMIGQQVLRRTIDEKLLSQAKDYVYALKQKDREKGSLLLEGKSRKVLDATAYLLLAYRAGVEISMAELSRLFHVSPNSISRMKRLVQRLDSEGTISTESQIDTSGKTY
ncbi:MAG: winged helix-turn-helix domain-containing protein [Conexivisphaerales archaeon]